MGCEFPCPGHCGLVNRWHGVLAGAFKRGFRELGEFSDAGRPQCSTGL